jgi:hypothetical protein
MFPFSVLNSTAPDRLVLPFLFTRKELLRLVISHNNESGQETILIVGEHYEKNGTNSKIERKRYQVIESFNRVAFVRYGPYLGTTTSICSCQSNRNTGNFLTTTPLQNGAVPFTFYTKHESRTGLSFVQYSLLHYNLHTLICLYCSFLSTPVLVTTVPRGR